ncbi:hypothetical protein BVX98_01820 [bacterium F11]|nr:hypothetical protein BVX98_01820 [bacterium F11]
MDNNEEKFSKVRPKSRLTREELLAGKILPSDHPENTSSLDDPLFRSPDDLLKKALKKTQPTQSTKPVKKNPSREFNIEDLKSGTPLGKKQDKTKEDTSSFGLDQIEIKNERPLFKEEEPQNRDEEPPTEKEEPPMITEESIILKRGESPPKMDQVEEEAQENTVETDPSEDSTEPRPSFILNDDSQYFDKKLNEQYSQPRDKQNLISSPPPVHQSPAQKEDKVSRNDVLLKTIYEMKYRHDKELARWKLYEQQVNNWKDRVLMIVGQLKKELLKTKSDLSELDALKEMLKTKDEELRKLKHNPKKKGK